LNEKLFAMKKYFLIITLSILSIVSNSQNKNFIDQPYIEVNGMADTLVIPNEIYIRILLSEKDTKDKVSLEELEKKMVEIFKSMNIDVEKDLTTSDIISNYKYYLLKNKDVLKSKVYTLKVVNAVTASNVFIKLEEAGISNVSIERVDHSDANNLRNKMRAKSITDAKNKAIALTGALNQTIGGAIHIIDNNIDQQLQGRVAGIQIRGVSSYKGVDELPKIEFEKIKITGNVNVKFMLK
jgi:uncharacterized protein